MRNSSDFLGLSHMMEWELELIVRPSIVLHTRTRTYLDYE